MSRPYQRPSKGKGKETFGLTYADMTVGQQKGFKGGKGGQGGKGGKGGKSKKGEPKGSATGPAVPAPAPTNPSA